MRFRGMRPGITISLSSADRRRLEVHARDRNTAQKHVWRAEIVLLSATGLGTNEIMRRTGKSKTCVWRWQERFAEAGYAGLAPHRVRRFKLSNDPDFVAKLRDVVGFYVDPPAHAIMLSVDEKSQIQALERTQPGLPM